MERKTQHQNCTVWGKQATEKNGGYGKGWMTTRVIEKKAIFNKAVNPECFTPTELLLITLCGKQQLKQIKQQTA